MINIDQTEQFEHWLHKLKDPLGKVGILARIKRAQGDTLYLLLIGGSKDSQTNDISKACTLWQQVKDQEKEHPNE